MTFTRQVIAPVDNVELCRIECNLEAIAVCAGGYVKGDRIAG